MLLQNEEVTEKTWNKETRTSTQGRLRGESWVDEWTGYIDSNQLRSMKKKRWYLVVRHLLEKDNCCFICYHKKHLVKYRERFTTDIEVWEKSIFNFKIKQLLTREKAKKI